MWNKSTKNLISFIIYLHYIFSSTLFYCSFYLCKQKLQRFFFI
jgi:hypothetical protein